MFGIINYKIFILMGIMLNLTPGPNTIFILARSLSQGRKAGIISVFGVSTGAIFHTLFAAFGLSVIIVKSTFIFTIIKYLGAIYLIYIGIITLKSKKKPSNLNTENELNYKKIFLSGLLTNITNPKVALFYISFLPQFIDVNNTYGILPFIFLGFTFILSGSLWYITMSVFSSSFIKKLKNNNTFSNTLNKVSGVIFIALGIKLLKNKGVINSIILYENLKLPSFISSKKSSLFNFILQFFLFLIR